MTAAHATPDELLAFLDELGVATQTREHQAVFTVAESRSLTQTLPGAHSKSLFLKDRKGALFLVVALNDTAIDLKRLHETVGAASRLSFASRDLLVDVLGVEPGSVTPFAAINDRSGRVSVTIDAALMAFDRLNFHPLVNTRTTAIARDDLLTFLRATGHEPAIARLPAPVAPAPGDAGHETG